MDLVVVGLGSNMGDKLKNLTTATALIANIDGCNLLSSSSIYESPAWGFEGEEFFNSVLLIKTDLKPNNLLLEFKKIEASFGRKKRAIHEAYSARKIDLDILIWEGLTLDSEELIIPHPQLINRDFVLEPIKEILQKNAQMEFANRYQEIKIEPLNIVLKKSVTKSYFLKCNQFFLEE